MAPKRDRAFEDIASAAARVNRVAGELNPPRGIAWLLDLAGTVGCGPGSLVLDAGGYAGAWARSLDERYGSRTVVCDLAPSAIENAGHAGSVALVADIEELPHPVARFDVVWCRDVLSMVGDPARVLDEFHRVSKPGGGLVLYAAFPTDRLEPLERRELLVDLGAPMWWDHGAQLIRDLFLRAGYDVVSETRTSPEHTQANLEVHGDLLQDWISLARLE